MKILAQSKFLVLEAANKKTPSRRGRGHLHYYIRRTYRMPWELLDRVKEIITQFGLTLPPGTSIGLTKEPLGTTRNRKLAEQCYSFLALSIGDSE